MSRQRDLDIVIYGATGFVGKLTAEYLEGAAPDGVTVGLAGRSKEKLEAVRAGLGSRAADWPLIVADSADASSLREMAEQAHVVVTTVGPYRQYGLPVVAACAEAGTDYLDLAGEVLFIRDAIDQHHEAAQTSGARIVTSCGFDSIPSDLGVFLLHQAAEADGAGDLEDTTFSLRAMKGGPSGGTIASMKGMLDDVKADAHLRRVAGDPYALSPDRSAEPDLGGEADLRAPVYDQEQQTWLAPFVMAAINTRVVRRSNALQQWAYGRRFRYREAMATGDGPAGRAKAFAIAAGLGLLVGGLSVGPLRSVLDRFLPAPGEGPSEATRAKGFFKIDIHTRTSTGSRYVCHISAQGDPGYAATAVMLGEGALCLVLDRNSLPERSGVLTPSTAMGSALADRLRQAGQRYDVEALG